MNHGRGCGSSCLGAKQASGSSGSRQRQEQNSATRSEMFHLLHSPSSFSPIRIVSIFFFVARSFEWTPRNVSNGTRTRSLGLLAEWYQSHSCTVLLSSTFGRMSIRDLFLAATSTTEQATTIVKRKYTLDSLSMRATALSRERQPATVEPLATLPYLSASRGSAGSRRFVASGLVVSET